MDKGPEGINELLAQAATYIWVVLLSGTAGAVRHLHEIRTMRKKFKLWVLVLEIATSALVGLLTYFFCRWANLNEWLSAMMVGVSGHAGARAMMLLEPIQRRIFGAASDKDSTP